MLPLVQLDTAQIERIVDKVPGGAANVQDIYPLAPLQEGILFHHMMARQGDAYVMPVLLGFDSRTRLNEYLDALQSVVNRNDVLRTAVLWQDLPEPVQVVWRKAELSVQEVALDAADGDIATQLRERFDPSSWRLELDQAPLMRVFIAADAHSPRYWPEQFVRYIDSYGQDKVMFGTDAKAAAAS
jgi:hypothetical protein